MKSKRKYAQQMNIENLSHPPREDINLENGGKGKEMGF